VSDGNPAHYRRRPGRGSQRPSPARLGLIRVGAGFADEFPDADGLSTEAYASLARTGTALLAELDRCILESFDMPHAAATALAVIEGAEQPLTPSEISERVLVASATMTATLDLLEGRGWIVRRPNPADRRSFLVEVTEAGRAAADRLLPGIRVVEHSVMSALTPRERQQLLGLLAKVLDRAATVSTKPPTPLEGSRNRPARPQAVIPTSEATATS
jgi:DNA-binding MarR family transcriptional regulator